MDTAVAGRIAEEVVYGRDNAETGAVGDFQNLMKIARSYVLRYGFSEKVYALRLVTTMANEIRSVTILLRMMNFLNYHRNSVPCSMGKFDH